MEALKQIGTIPGASEKTVRGTPGFLEGTTTSWVLTVNMIITDTVTHGCGNSLYRVVPQIRHMGFIIIYQQDKALKIPAVLTNVLIKK